MPPAPSAFNSDIGTSGFTIIHLQADKKCLYLTWVEMGNNHGYILYEPFFVFISLYIAVCLPCLPVSL